ncbi:MAG: chemotaxis protein CheA [Oligoflexales bacterium]|nr:chemotaxis protein CheA [Oligoflexales bacterium]
MGFFFYDQSDDKKQPQQKDKGPDLTKNTEKHGSIPAARTVRIRVDTLDQLMRLASELVLVRNQQLRILDRTDDKIRSSTQRLDNITTEIQGQIMATRMQPIGNIFTKYERMVRDLSLKLGKKIALKTEGNDVELDKTILENLTDPLMHIIRNCCDHGIEDQKARTAASKSATGEILIRAFHEGGLVNIEIKDDGRGISVERLVEKALKKGIKSPDELAKMSQKDTMQLIFHPGFSTSDVVSDISGRGFGMDIVRMNIEKLGGSIDVKSIEGAGTEIFLRLPLTLAIIPCLVVTCLSQVFAIPQVNLEELIGLTEKEAFTKIDYVGHREVFRVRDSLLPLIRLQEVLENKNPFTEHDYFDLMKKNQLYQKQVLDRKKNLREKMFFFVVLKAGNERFGLVVDEIKGTEEVVISPMHSSIKNIHIYSGATVRGDGRVSLILDAFGISEFTRIFDSVHYKNVKLNYKKQHHYEDLSNREPLLLFSHNNNEQFSIEQRDIKRVVKINPNQIQTIAKNDLITLYDDPTLIFYLDEHLEVSKSEPNTEAFLIIPKATKIAVGIFATSLTDIGNYHLKDFKYFNTGAGIKGSSIVNGRITLHLDLPFILNQYQKNLSTVQNLDTAS